MSDLTYGKGSCLCGAVQFSTDTFNPKMSACHCTTCRKWGGGPMLVADCQSEVTFKGDNKISIFNSSDWAERGFCNQCGTHLFYKLKESRQHFLPIGLFDNDADVVFDHQVFIDEKPEYYHFSNKTEEMTGAQLFAQYGATQD